MIRYRKLFVLLAEKGMKKTDLIDVLSFSTLAKLTKGGIVTTGTIQEICLFLECQPGDIMECVRD